MNKLFLSCAGIALLLSACNTMEGMGRDIKAGGENMEGAAHETHQEMKRDERYPNE